MTVNQIEVAIAVVVKNEKSADFYFDTGTSGKKTLLSPGKIATLTDHEFQSIPIAMRGPGGINVLYPDETTPTSNKLNLDWGTAFTTPQLFYFGVNRQEALDNEQTWTIKFFKYVQMADSSVKVSQIQVMENVAWTDRASLPWT